MTFRTTRDPILGTFIHLDLNILSITIVMITLVILILIVGKVYLCVILALVDPIELLINVLYILKNLCMLSLMTLTALLRILTIKKMRMNKKKVQNLH